MAKDNWGGAREGAGAKSTWKHGGAGTKLIRIPVALESQILSAARRIDVGVNLIPDDSVIDSSRDLETENSHLRQRLEAREEMVALLQKKLKKLNEEYESLYRENQYLKSQHDIVTDSNSSRVNPLVMVLLDEAVKLKANAGGAIKLKIKEAQALLQERHETVTESNKLEEVA